MFRGVYKSSPLLSSLLHFSVCLTWPPKCLFTTVRPPLPKAPQTKVQGRSGWCPPPAGRLDSGEDGPALCGQCWEAHTHFSGLRRSAGGCLPLSSPAPQHPARRSKESTGSPGPRLAHTWLGSGCAGLHAVLGSRLCRLETPHHFITRDPKFITGLTNLQLILPQPRAIRWEQSGHLLSCWNPNPAESILPPTAGYEPAPRAQPLIRF